MTWIAIGSHEHTNDKPVPFAAQRMPALANSTANDLDEEMRLFR
ncbi:MAG: hypothetical protein ABL997_15035 [Planctomycetota bacterium]